MMRRFGNISKKNLMQKSASKNGKDAIDTTHKSSTCTICLDSVSNTPLPCGHIFHNKCIETWKQKSNTCPNCRVTLDMNSSKKIEGEAGVARQQQQHMNRRFGDGIFQIVRWGGFLLRRASNFCTPIIARQLLHNNTRNNNYAYDLDYYEPARRNIDIFLHR